MTKRPFLGKNEVSIHLQFTPDNDEWICDGQLSISFPDDNLFRLSCRSWDCGCVPAKDLLRCVQPMVNSFFRRKQAAKAVEKVLKANRKR